MVRAGHLSGAALLLLGAVAASAGDAAGRSAIKDVQDAERLIAAAITAGDATSVSAQSGKLSRLLGQLPDRLDGDARFPCISATQQLYNVVLDFRLPPARRELAVPRDLGLYREAMPRCERAVGAPAPGRPSLR